MALPDPNRVAFDDVKIDLEGRRLFRAGALQALEPKAFGVLALLVRAPGRVFTRDEIMDAVWGHRHVTPGVLNRVVTLLRHALGEDAHDPRYLHTVHGVGYRLDLPAAEAGATVEPPSDPVAPPLRPPGEAAVDPAAATEVAADGVLPGASRTTRRLAWLLVPVLLLAAAGTWWWGARSSEREPASNAPGPAVPPTLVVVPLKPIGGSDGVRTIADGLSEELIGNLARIDGLRVIAQQSTQLAVAESEDPARLGHRLGVSHVLQGSLQQQGQILRVRLRLVDARTGAALWARDFDHDAADVLALEHDIARSVATSLTLRLGLPTASSSGGDAEFLRRFLAAQQSLHDASLPLEQRTDASEAEFRALLRERPDDARTRAALAVALNFRAFMHPDLPAAVSDEALQEAVTAQRLDPSLAEPYFVQSFIACQRNQWDPCMALMQEADRRGMKVPPLANPAVVLARLGYLDRAEAVAREWSRRDPLNIQADFTLGRLLDTMGRHEEARAKFASSRHVVPFSHYGHWFNAYWRKDYADAQTLVNEGLAATDENWPRLKPGYVAIMRALQGQGSWTDVETANRRFERETGLFALLRVIEPDAPDHVADLVDGLQRMRKGSYSTWDLVLWQKEFAFLRQGPAFQDYLRRDGILAYWKQHGFPLQCRRRGDGADCE